MSGLVGEMEGMVGEVVVFGVGLWGSVWMAYCASNSVGLCVWESPRWGVLHGEVRLGACVLIVGTWRLNTVTYVHRAKTREMKKVNSYVIGNLNNRYSQMGKENSSDNGGLLEDVGEG